jgi:DNA-damage-inducible protein J
MGKTVTVQARMEPKLKEQADEILASIGITASTAITMFYKQVVLQRGMPIELKVPNADTIAAIKELQDPSYRRKAKKFNSVDDLFTDLNS